MTKEQRNQFEDIVTATEVLIQYYFACQQSLTPIDYKNLNKFKKVIKELVEKTGFTNKFQKQLSKQIE